MNEMPDWLKVALVLAGLISSNGITNGLNYGLLAKPAEERAIVKSELAEDRDAYAASTEKRLYTCQDRLAKCYADLNECQGGE
jgi:hypothetical protein